MSHTGLVFEDRFIEHDTGAGHPERSDRLRAIHERFAASGLGEACIRIEPKPIDPVLIERVHPQEYVTRFANACKAGVPYLDSPECPLESHTFDIASLAVGGGIEAVDAVMAGRVRNAFCAVRPPGHHAEHRTAMGFCYFNNIAIVAEYLRLAHELERVAIVDFDVHHGNGTQHHFDRDPSVLVCSVHQDPLTLYPGTGFAEEIGVGPGEGSIVNVPMTAGSGDDDYKKVFEEIILPRVEAFAPQFLLVSAGFDGHKDDPLAGIGLSTSSFGWMTKRLSELAADCCQGRLVSTLEGGYELRALADAVEAHVTALVD